MKEAKLSLKIYELHKWPHENSTTVLDSSPDISQKSSSSVSYKKANSSFGKTATLQTSLSMCTRIGY